jgi:creatinine amidohydrolase
MREPPVSEEFGSDLGGTGRPIRWERPGSTVSGSGVWGRGIEKATAEHGEAEMRRCIETTRAIAAGIGEPWPQPR